MWSPGFTPAMLHDQHGPGVLQGLVVVRHVAGEGDVVARPQLDRLAGRPGQDPPGAGHEVLDAARDVRVGLARLAGPELHQIDVTPGVRRSRREQGGHEVGAVGLQPGPLPGAFVVAAATTAALLRLAGWH